MAGQKDFVNSPPELDRWPCSEPGCNFFSHEKLAFYKHWEDVHQPKGGVYHCILCPYKNSNEIIFRGHLTFHYRECLRFPCKTCGSNEAKSLEELQKHRSKNHRAEYRAEMSLRKQEVLKRRPQKELCMPINLREINGKSTLEKGSAPEHINPQRITNGSVPELLGVQNQEQTIDNSNLLPQPSLLSSNGSTANNGGLAHSIPLRLEDSSPLASEPVVRSGPSSGAELADGNALGSSGDDSDHSSDEDFGVQSPKSPKKGKMIIDNDSNAEPQKSTRFQCAYCSSSFRTSGGLYSHIKVHPKAQKGHDENPINEIIAVDENLGPPQNLVIDMSDSADTGDEKGEAASEILLETITPLASVEPIASDINVETRRELVSTNSTNPDDQSKPFQCPSCSFSALTKSGLSRHISNHRGKGLYQCNHCSFSAARRCEISRHSKIHEIVPDTPTILPDSSQPNIAQNIFLLQTARSVILENPFGSTKDIVPSLLPPVQVAGHLSEESKLDPIVDLEMQDVESLKSARKHSSDSGKCPHCSYVGSKLHLHLLRHNPSKFQCELCKYYFHTLGMLRKHVSTYHKAQNATTQEGEGRLQPMQSNIPSSAPSRSSIFDSTIPFVDLDRTSNPIQGIVPIEGVHSSPAPEVNPAFEINVELMDSEPLPTEKPSSDALNEPPMIQGEVVQKNNAYYCPHCNFWQYTPNQVRKHLLSHGIPSRFQCEVCKLYFTEKDLTGHYEKAGHDPEPSNSDISSSDETADNIKSKKSNANTSSRKTSNSIASLIPIPNKLYPNKTKDLPQSSSIINSNLRSNPLPIEKPTEPVKENLGIIESDEEILESPSKPTRFSRSKSKKNDSEILEFDKTDEAVQPSKTAQSYPIPIEKPIEPEVSFHEINESDEEILESPSKSSPRRTTSSKSKKGESEIVVSDNPDELANRHRLNTIPVSKPIESGPRENEVVEALPKSTPRRGIGRPKKVAYEKPEMIDDIFKFAVTPVRRSNRPPMPKKFDYDELVEVPRKRTGRPRKKEPVHPESIESDDESEDEESLKKVEESVVTPAIRRSSRKSIPKQVESIESNEDSEGEEEEKIEEPQVVPSSNRRTNRKSMPKKADSDDFSGRIESEEEINDEESKEKVEVKSSIRQSNRKSTSKEPPKPSPRNPRSRRGSVALKQVESEESDEMIESEKEEESAYVEEEEGRKSSKLPQHSPKRRLGFSEELNGEKNGHVLSKPDEAEVSSAKIRSGVSLSKGAKESKVEADEPIPSSQRRLLFCSLCPYTTGKQAALKAHQALHKTPGKALKCDICGQICPDKSVMTTHLKKHNSGQPYPKPKSKPKSKPKAYTPLKNKGVAKNSKEVLPSEEESSSGVVEIVSPNSNFLCPFCTRSFKTMTSFRIHTEQQHNSPIKTPPPSRVRPTSLRREPVVPKESEVKSDVVISEDLMDTLQ